MPNKVYVMFMYNRNKTEVKKNSHVKYIQANNINDCLKPIYFLLLI